MTNVQKAADLRQGGPKPPHGELLELKRALVREGERDAARELHAWCLEQDQNQAHAWLSSGSAPPPEALLVAKRLARDQHVGLARRLLKLARKGLTKAKYPTIYLEMYQKSVLYTYKDPGLPVSWRLDRALDLLGEVEDLATTTDPETLGLAGAIHKRKWEVDTARHHLERALFFYLRGYAQSAPASARGRILGFLHDNPQCILKADTDQGYNGINAAFILDLLARQEEEEARRAGMTSEAAEGRRRYARLIREEIVRSVPGVHEQFAHEWWFYATIGEAFFGLGRHDAANYAKAGEWLVQKPAAAGLERSIGASTTGALDIPEWQFESTARQLARLALLQGPPELSEAAFMASDAGLTLADILTNDREAVLSSFRGKVGLALSGGGFRAALFHVGVLASLAEHGVLPHVEVLSCVSGGSIIGAHYYLELRHLLQNERDEAMTPAHYVDIIARIEHAFLEGVQRNIRMRVVAEWTTNLKMIFRPGYSRTLRVGELYERELFSRVADSVPSPVDAQAQANGRRLLPAWLARRLDARPRERWLDGLCIHPLANDGTPEQTFVPRTHNWRRRNKVPELILNATSLNTGHGWQFTPSFMGESPAAINPTIDANDRLRRLTYAQAPLIHRRLRLGHAVAASSCVPGLFGPLRLDGLYDDRSVRLVDGGVCDNQGVASLLEQDCTVALVSDASGQMESQRTPSANMLGVPLRANGILQARAREAQYTDIASRARAMLLRGLMFVHLKRDLRGEQVAWINCPSYSRTSDFTPEREGGDDATSYGILAAVQRRLAAIRTDLDSFHDLEACALMTSGYRMTNAELEAEHPSLHGFKHRVVQGKWRFLEVEEAMVPRPPAKVTGQSPAPELDAKEQRAYEQRRAYLERCLLVGAFIPFKVWHLSRALQVLAWCLAAAAMGVAAWGVWFYRHLRIGAAIAGDTTLGMAATFAATMAATAVAAFVLNRVLGPTTGAGVMKAVRWRETLQSIATGISMALGGWLIARLHLHIFDRWYLWSGKLQRLRDRA